MAVVSYTSKLTQNDVGNYSGLCICYSIVIPASGALKHRSSLLLFGVFKYHLAWENRVGAKKILIDGFRLEPPEKAGIPF